MSKPKHALRGERGGRCGVLKHGCSEKSAERRLRAAQARNAALRAWLKAVREPLIPAGERVWP